MNRVAVVTGGTRGIGEAISVALKEAGRTVVAIYAGNDQAAEAFALERHVSPVDVDPLPAHPREIGDADRVIRVPQHVRARDVDRGARRQREEQNAAQRSQAGGAWHLRPPGVVLNECAITGVL